MVKRAKPEIKFPFGGVVETTSYADQPAGTCSDALNVRPYDSLKARKRGGQRAGQAKYISDAVNGTSAIQSLGSVALAFETGDIVATSEPFSRDFTDSSIALGDLDVVDPGAWEIWKTNFFERGEGTTASLTVKAAAGFHERSLQVTGTTDNSMALYADAANPITLGTQYIMNCRSTGDGTIWAPIMAVRVAEDSGNFIGVEITTSGSITVGFVKYTSSLRSALSIDSGSTTVTSNIVGAVTDPQDYSLEVSGNTFTLKVNGGVQWVGTDSSFTSNTGFAWGAHTRVGPGVQSISSLNVQLAESPASLRTTKLVAVSGGNIYAGSKVTGLTVPGGGTAAVVGSGNVTQQDAFQKVYFADGLSSGYRVYSPKLNTVVAWQDSITAGALPVGGSGVEYDITAVDTTAGTFTVVEDLSSVFSSGDFMSVQDGPTNNNRSYTVASVSGTGPTVLTVDQTIQSSTVSGTLSVGDVACRILALYRGRVVASGIETDPSNWFMSASEDPNDWDYFPATENDQQAIAGNVNQAGKLEDIVTALMPYLDDVMFFGGDHTLWKLSGDPAAESGRFDNVSRQIGVVGPDAWTYDSKGNLYFLGQNGLYRVPVGGLSLEQVGADKLDDTFSQLNFSANRVRLLYDREWRGVHIFITPTSEPTTGTINYFWDERTDGFWPDQYPASMGPTAVHLFDADAFDDRAVLLGGWDSIIRTFDRTVKDDDGTAISSHVLFTPIIAGDTGRVSATDITVNLAEGSDSNAILQVFASGTAENAAAQTTIKAAKVLSEGRNAPLNQRVADNVIQLKIIDSTISSTWSLESGSVGIKLAGNVRKEETE
jgi:hypothetical protein